MVKIDRAILIEDGKEIIISIFEALEQRGRAYLCPECKQRVRPFKESHDNKIPAHFEHKKRNPDCSLSDKERK